MITTTEDLVIFTTPILIALFAFIIVCIAVENVFFVHGIFCIIAAILTVGLIVASVVFGAKYQELLIALIVIAIVQMFSLKLHADGDGKADIGSLRDTAAHEVKN